MNERTNYANLVFIFIILFFRKNKKIILIFLYWNKQKLNEKNYKFIILSSSFKRNILLLFLIFVFSVKINKNFTQKKFLSCDFWAIVIFCHCLLTQRRRRRRGWKKWMFLCKISNFIRKIINSKCQWRE